MAIPHIKGMAMNTTLSLPIEKSMVEAIDKWRGQQPGVPSRSEAIRKMVQHALDSGLRLETESESVTDGG